jgi:Mg-chelatase subunit ChlD
MHTCITLTPEDLRKALRSGAALDGVAERLRRRLKIPSAAKIENQPLLAHLQPYAPVLEALAQGWLQGHPLELSDRSAGHHSFHLLPFCPQGLSARDYLEPLLKKHRPAVIALDADAFETAAAIQYGCSLYYALGIAGRCTLNDSNGTPVAERFFNPDDFLPALALLAYSSRIPLLPLGTPRRLIASEHQHAYRQMLSALYREFAAHAPLAHTPAALEKLAADLMSALFATGQHMALERENCISRSCALASRTSELLHACAGDRKLRGPVFALYHIEAALDFPALVTAFLRDQATESELGCAPEPHVPGTLARLAPAADSASDDCAAAVGRPAYTALLAVILERMADSVSLQEADRLIAELARALRGHPRVERPAGVRATLAACEIAQSFALLRGSISRATLAQAVCIAFTHRTRMASGPGPGWEEVFKSLVSRCIYGIELEPAAGAVVRKPLRALTRDELDQALEGLMDAGVRQLEPDEALPLDNPEFAQEVMNHPMVQQALKDAASELDGEAAGAEEMFTDMMQQMAERGLLEKSSEQSMTLSSEGQDQYRGALEDAHSRGELSAEDLSDALSRADSMPRPSGLEGQSMQLPMPADEQAGMLAELMDFQHQGRSESSSVEDLYVHYTIDENKGIPVSKDKVDYERLKVILHQLEEQGHLKLSSEGRLRFTLTHRALSGLLEGLVRRRERGVLERRAFKREHETDKSEIRRYRRGDVFRDISLRHTIRRIMRKGKSFEDINYTDLRAFEKQPSNQLDIAVCVDISASMKEGGKLRYAKMAVAELCRAAVEKRDRVGIVAFSNLGDVMVPLSDTITPLLEATMQMRSKQFTNIGNGLSTSRRMLQKSRKENPKYIILITDGEPNAALSDDIEGADYYTRIAQFSRETTMETKRAMGARHALQEASRTRRERIKISVVYIATEAGGIDESERVAREIARIGSGRFHRVRTIENLPLETLEAVV